MSARGRCQFRSSAEKRNRHANHTVVIKGKGFVMRPFIHRFLAVAALLLVALLCATLAAKYLREGFGFFPVTTTADSGPGSLRNAIEASGDGDTIYFVSALNGQTINLTSGELAINANITITGPG